MTVRTRLSRLLLAAARRLDPAAGEHAPAEGD